MPRGKRKRSKAAKAKNKRFKKAFGKGKAKTKNTSVTFQHDRGTEYISRRLSGAAKRRANFEKRVVVALQKKMAPNYMLFNQPSANFAIPSNEQIHLSAMLWTANGIAGTSNDIFRIYNQIGGPTSATKGYNYDLHLHYGILEVDMCLETTALAVAQCFVDVYTIKCRKDVASATTANAGRLKDYPLI